MKKFFCLILALLILASAAITANAAAVSTKNPKRALAVVYDNSNSMYKKDSDSKLATEDQPYAWCRAIYAMEAFATMMNDNDVMQIYPMWEITVDGKKYDTKSPLTITQKNASDIRKIYTPTPSNTPIETITAAYNGLNNLSADEKWLVVLTDGDVFYKGGDNLKDKTVSSLNTVLGDCVKNVNVMYLGIGKQAAMPSVKGGTNTFFADKAEDSTKVLEKLSAMCNMIFGRDTLPGVTDKVTFDVSMSKLIVFIQGDGISNVKLGNLSARTSNALKYSTLGCGHKESKDTFRVDETLQGMMLTYTGLDAGTYSLSYSGKASSVVCYYEPDVDLKAQVLDVDGNPVDPTKPIMAGTYTLKYELVDKHGKVTNSNLLGKQKYKVSYTINGKTETVSVDKAGSLPLQMNPKDTFDVNFEVTYLDDYTITRTSGDLGWPAGGLKFEPPEAGTLAVKLSGGQSQYSLSKLPNEEIYRLSFTLDGKDCTDEQLGRIKVNATVKDAKVAAKVDRDDQGYFVKLDYNNTALETDIGNFELLVTGQYTSEDNKKSNKASDSANFSINDDSRELEMYLEIGQTYYQISKIGDAKPLTLKVFFSGDPLTEEEMKSLKVYLDNSDVNVSIEPDYANSCYKVYFDPENPPEKGSYKLTFKADGENEIGKKVSAEQKTKVKFGNMPMWLRILLPILIILLIALLVWLYLKQPVLPKRIKKTDESYTVGGDMITGSKPIQYSGSRKKTGEVKVVSVNCPFDNLAVQGVRLQLEAVTPRYVFNAKQKKARVVKIMPINPSNVLSLQIKTKTLVPNSDPDGPTGLVDSTTGQPVKPFEISNNTQINIVSDTGENTAVYHCKLVFE